MSGDATIKEFQVALQAEEEVGIGQVAVFQQADPDCQVGASIAQIDQRTICRFIAPHIHSCCLHLGAAASSGLGLVSALSSERFEQSEMLFDGR